MITTEMTRTEMIAAAKEAAQKECESEFGFRRRQFVRITGTKGWDGKVGRIRKYVDERTEKHPNIAVEIEVVFEAGQGASPVAFLPNNLEAATEPRNWGK